VNGGAWGRLRPGLPEAILRIPDSAFQAIRLPEYEPRMTGTLVYQSRSGGTTQSVFVTPS